MARANKRTRRLTGRRLRRQIHSRRLAAARKAEDAWEAEKAEPIRGIMRTESKLGFPLSENERRLLAEKIEKIWPMRNKTKRGFVVFGITKSMLSRSRRGRNRIVVAD